MKKGTLYSDDNPKTTLKGLGFKNEDKAKETIEKVEKYFDKLMKKQKINSYTPDNVLPKKLLTTKKEIKKYYQLQKMYRILGMSNRAKGMVNKVNKNKDLKKAIKIFDKWIKTYKKC